MTDERVPCPRCKQNGVSLCFLCVEQPGGHGGRVPRLLAIEYMLVFGGYSVVTMTDATVKAITDMRKKHIQ